jgi:rubrerythrin
MSNELHIVLQAILNEEEGASFYALAAETATARTVKEAFAYLRDQETQHSKWIRALYDRLVLEKASSNLEWAESNKKAQSPAIFSANAPAFNLAIMDLAVFAAGALIEKASIAFYQQASKDAQSPEAKQLFTQLIDWEKEHLDQLQSIHEALSAEWLDQFEFTHSPQL